MIRPSLAFILALLAMACKSKAPPPPAPIGEATVNAGSAPSAAASSSSPTPAASAGEPTDAGADLGKMAHCPSSVNGAKSVIDDVPGGVTVTVTAADPAGASAIRSRARVLSLATKSGPGKVEHNGSGEGGGTFGRCPVIVRRTSVSPKDIEGGSKITVTADNPKEVDWLRQEARNRNSELSMPGSEGAGMGKMAHCPNAVQGATTHVTDTKDAVQITVTAQDDASVKDIRNRTQLIVAASKRSPAAVEHDGKGDGGGGLGRCPVMFKDTELQAKEIPSGVTISVKPKQAASLKRLDREIRARSAKFAP